MVLAPSKPLAPLFRSRSTVHVRKKSAMCFPPLAMLCAHHCRRTSYHNAIIRGGAGPDVIPAVWVDRYGACPGQKLNLISSEPSNMIVETAYSTLTRLRIRDHCLWAQVPCAERTEQGNVAAIDLGRSWSLCFLGKSDGMLSGGSLHCQRSANRFLIVEESRNYVPTATWPSESGFRRWKTTGYGSGSLTQ